MFYETNQGLININLARSIIKEGSNNLKFVFDSNMSINANFTDTQTRDAQYAKVLEFVNENDKVFLNTF